MPQLKIVDVQTEMRENIKKLDEKISVLADFMNKVAAAVNQINDSGKTVELKDAAKLTEEIMKLRADLIGHVEVYNNHIIQQHPKK